MKVFLRIAALAAVVVTAVYAPGTAKPASIDGGASKGPACADINGGGVVHWDSSTGQLVFGLNTEKPSCTDVTYTVYATFDDGTMVYSGSAPGNRFIDTDVIPNQPRVDVTVAGPADAKTACIFATSSGKEGNQTVVYDRAPDTGCVVFDLATGNTGVGGSFG